MSKKSADLKNGPAAKKGAGAKNATAAKNGAGAKREAGAKKGAGGKRSGGEKKSADSTAVRTTLSAAAGDRTFVRVRRSVAGSDEVEGFVVGIGSVWTWMARLDRLSISLDGSVAVRTAEVTTVQPLGGHDGFVCRALVAQGQWPPTAPDAVELDDVGGLLRSLAPRFGLVALSDESAHPDRCLVGHVLAVTARSVALVQITPEAHWHDRPTTVPLAAVSRVDVGDRYLAVLLAVGGPPPSFSHRGK